jgi:hypothetical protein
LEVKKITPDPCMTIPAGSQEYTNCLLRNSNPDFSHVWSYSTYGTPTPTPKPMSEATETAGEIIAVALIVVAFAIIALAIAVKFTRKKGTHHESR